MGSSELVMCSLAWVMLVFCVLGVFGNAVSICIFRQASMRSSINTLLAGLSAVDLVMVILVVPSFVVVGLSVCQHWLLDAIPYIAVFIYPLTLTTQSCSVWIFVVITAERWVAVCRPLQAPRLCTIGNSKKALIAVSSMAILYNVPRWFEYRLTVNDNNQSNALHKEQLWLRADTDYVLVYYTLLFIVTHFVLPFGLLMVANIHVIRTVFTSSWNTIQQPLISRRKKKEQKTSVMMAVVVLVFLICNMLPFVLNVIAAINPDFFTDEGTNFVAFVLNDVANLLVVVNSSTNCFIYYIFSEKYRNCLHHLWKRGWGQDLKARSSVLLLTSLLQPSIAKTSVVEKEDVLEHFKNMI